MLMPSLEEIRAAWWYYTVQVEDGSIIKGMYPDGYPFPPRIMQRKVDLRGMDCLDIGSAEGLLPILAKKSGARSVVATDFAEHDQPKMRYLSGVHGVDLQFQAIGRAQNVAELVDRYPEGFDYINLSGVLYHVSSPMDAVIAARSLLRPGGVMLVSTIYLPSPDCFMAFNDHGRYQPHHNVFWYLSLGFYEYMLRMAALEPIDVLYFGEPDKGYCSVICKAVDAPLILGEDTLLQNFLSHSVEADVLRASFAREMPASKIQLRSGPNPGLKRRTPDRPCVDLYASLPDNPGLVEVTRTQDTRLFLLDDVD
jgi:2-polyprenyl-3-methyl-5-hydroxy-6-metoxy-1,4-benzoquinol methylase